METLPGDKSAVVDEAGNVCHGSSISRRRGGSCQTYSDDGSTDASETEKRPQRTPRKRRNSDRPPRKRHYSSRPGPLSLFLTFLARTIKTLVILPLADILGWFTFYLLSAILVLVLGIITLKSLPFLLPRILFLLLPRATFFPSVLQRGIHEVANLPNTLGERYCSTIGIGCRSVRGETAEEMIGNLTYSATSQVRQASKVITSLNNLDSTSNSLALDSVPPQPPPKTHINTAPMF